MLWWTLRQLNSSDYKRREKAVKKLLAARAVKPLIKALSNENYDVRAEAAKALGKIADPSAVEPLIRTLRDGTVNVRQCAAYALKDIGDARAAMPLVMALKDGSEYVRSAALTALETLGAETIRDPGAVEPMVTLLKKGTWDGGPFAARVLGEIGGTSVVGPLVSELRGYSDQKDEAIIEALKKVGGAMAIEPLLAALKDAAFNQQRSVVMKALDELEWQPADDYELALRAIAHQNWDELSTLGEAGIERLSAALGDVDKEVQSAAAIALAKIGGARIAELLKEKINSSDLLTKIAAASALLKIDPEWAQSDAAKKYVGLLMEKLKDANLREIAIEALAEIRSPHAIKLLVNAINDPNWEVEKSAITALERIKAPESVGPLLDKIRIKDGSPDGWCHEAEIAVAALHKIMGAIVQEIPREVLKVAATLPNYPSFSQTNECFTYSRQVNCSQLVQIARQELLRRAPGNRHSPAKHTFDRALTMAMRGASDEAIKLFESIPADAAEYRAAIFNRAILWARGGQARVAVPLLESLQESSAVVTAALRECREAADKDSGLAWDSAIELVQTL